MSQVIRLPQHIYQRLAKHRIGFDTPVDVIERLLDQVEGVDHTKQQAITPTSPMARDRTQYLFQDQHFGKGRLVLAVVKQHVAMHAVRDVETLRQAFPKQLQGGQGVFDTQETAQEIIDRTGHKRHFVKPEELIDLGQDVIAVSTEWGAGNIDRFIEQARALGHTIEISG